jgi:hypothetical protein
MKACARLWRIDEGSLDSARATQAEIAIHHHNLQDLYRIHFRSALLKFHHYCSTTPIVRDTLAVELFSLRKWAVSQINLF